ncbi:HAAS signaling domain-containing protein [Conexibacter woesei]|uniref:Uncharacterized protein n=1 Tax=Conexibacter woesei (strain DSM 14684 / CCUG 47730 / CIP 108061 / JCM 11494 / NBRC 100937 / ID131577) TaxID=469383 RepID=D3F3B9_CONWI|nr:hypothetical protein [Conexibacter woesei]ADB50399.1 hypothetical protein Cwoe_1973 [Conexibacter woesei DSM 14684]
MTTAPATDRLVDDYLDRLEDELADAPSSRRRELVDEISTHIEEARAALADGGTEAEVRMLLDRLGDPAEIAAGVYEDAPPAAPAAPARAAYGWAERITLFLLPVGGLLIPLIGWFAGVVLLWTSDAWTTKDKLIGTFVLPGGYVALVWVTLMGGSSSDQACVTSVGPTGRALGSQCTGDGGSAFADVLAVAGIAILLIAPLATVVYLGMRLSGRAHAPRAGVGRRPALG